MTAAPPARLAWVDPGGMTGIAMLDHSMFFASEYEFMAACSRLEDLCQWYGPQLHIGYERFTIGPATHKLSPQPEAYEIPGVIKYMAMKWGCVLLKPALPEQRLSATPKMLQRLEWWTPGKDDAQAASQHLLAWMLRENCLPADTARALHGIR